MNQRLVQSLALSSAVILHLFSAQAAADVWKCEDANHRIIYKTEVCEKFDLQTVKILIRDDPPPKPANAKRKAKDTAKPIVRDEKTVFRTVATAMTLIKRGLRDPDSVVWEYAGANDPGDTICITYRAKNGFGGYSREHMVVNDNGGSQSLLLWNKVCAGKQMNDFTYAKHAVP